MVFTYRQCHSALQAPWKIPSWQTILLRALATGFSDPERGMVVFVDPDDPTGKTLYVKRIIMATL